MRFARPRKAALLQYLDDDKQAEWDKRWDTRPDVTGEEFGNDQKCRTCGAPPGKQCVKADGSFRNYPHQKRRDDAFRWAGTVKLGERE